MTLLPPTADEHVINYLHGHLGLRVGDTGGSAMAHLATLWEEHPQQVALSLDELAPWIPQLSAQSLGVAWRAILDQEDDDLALAFLRLIEPHHLLAIVAISMAGVSGDTQLSVERRVRMLRLCLTWREAGAGGAGVQALCQDAGPFLLHRAMRDPATLPVVDLLLEHAWHDPCAGTGPDNWILSWILGLTGQSENPGSGAVLARLVTWGAALDARDEDGRTALMLACDLHERMPGSQDFVDAIQWLVVLGVSWDEVNESQWPRAAALIRRHPLLVGQALDQLVAEQPDRDDDRRRM